MSDYIATQSESSQIGFLTIPRISFALLPVPGALLLVNGLTITSCRVEGQGKSSGKFQATVTTQRRYSPRAVALAKTCWFAVQTAKLTARAKVLNRAH